MRAPYIHLPTFALCSLFLIGPVTLSRAAQAVDTEAAPAPVHPVVPADELDLDETNECRAPRADVELADYQEELLDLAYSAASKFPLRPHIKNRSRAQEAVANAAFELDAPNRALTYVKGIANWRKGAGYAEYAFQIAREGDSKTVREYLRMARQLVELEEDWRAHSILAGIARTHLRIGEVQRAAAISENLGDAQLGEVYTVRAELMDAEAFAAELDWIRQSFAAGNLDQVRVALDVCEQLFDRFYADGERRAAVLIVVEESLRKAPLDMGIRTLLALAESATAHEDRDHGRRLTARAFELIESVEWLPEHRIPLVARAAEVQFRAGAEEEAKKALGSTLGLFERKRELIVDIWRADALIPVAAAYAAMGQESAARAIYAQALEEGVLNPNSRPRAKDLVSICCSMATRGVEPGEALLERLREVEASLGDPW